MFPQRSLHMKYLYVPVVKILSNPMCAGGNNCMLFPQLKSHACWIKQGIWRYQFYRDPGMVYFLNTVSVQLKDSMKEHGMLGWV